jgi:hypothetical protein
MTFTFDKEATLDAMAYSGRVDLEHGQVTMYAVTCVGNGEAPHWSHGGQVCWDAAEAIEAAEYLNSLNHPCHYLPLALGTHPTVILALAQAMLRPGLEEDA